MMKKPMNPLKNENAMTVLMEVSRLIMCEFNQHQVVFLKEKNGRREFPIIMGLFEAIAIDRRLRKLPVQRPLTHDLLFHTIELLGGKVLDIIINRAEEQTFFAQIRIEHGGKVVIQDSRPSDAIALALCSTPPLALYVTEELLNRETSQRQLDF